MLGEASLAHPAPYFLNMGLVEPPHEICSRNRNAVAANQIACSRNVTVMVRVISNIVS